jgi:hypothetical protein
VYIRSKCLPLLFVVSIFSCTRAKEKAAEWSSNARQEMQEQVERQAQKAIDKVIPPFDHDRPDTDNNRQRFRDFIRVEITPDVQNIYCFNDDIVGIDADYMFAFNCNQTTSDKIIELHKFEPDTATNRDNGFGLQHDFPWWDKTRIARLPKYKWNDGGQYFKYYWYDKDNQQAYFFDFDM